MKGEEICCTVYDEWKDGWSSMSRTTGLTACAITNLIIDKELTKTGVITPEELGTNQEYFDYATGLKMTNKKFSELFPKRKHNIRCPFTPAT